MIEAHERVVEAQFGPRAKAYVESAVHSQGADLDAIGAIGAEAQPRARARSRRGRGPRRLCPREPMPGGSSRPICRPKCWRRSPKTAREKGLGNIETAEAPAERLPFEDGTFDFVASRFSAHHWRDFERGLREARRTLKRGGRAVFVDAFAPGQALFDTHLQAIELLRDHSHVRDYTCAQWLDALAPLRASGSNPAGPGG